MNDKLDYEGLYNLATRNAWVTAIKMFPDIGATKAQQWFYNERDRLYLQYITPPCNCK